jgi:hypothetical protein
MEAHARRIISALRLAAATSGATAAGAGEAEGLAFHTGPVLGCAGPDFFTVAIRTTVPAAVTLKAGGKSYASPAGLIHASRRNANRWSST